MLKVRLLNVGYHSPLEAAYKPCFETRDLRWRAIAGQDDLAAGFVEGVESVKELLLGGFLPFEEVNVVDKEQVNLAVAPPKLLCSTALDRAD